MNEKDMKPSIEVPTSTRLLPGPNRIRLRGGVRMTAENAIMSVNYVETREANGYRVACDGHAPLFFGPVRMTKGSAEEDMRLHRIADHTRGGDELIETAQGRVANLRSALPNSAIDFKLCGDPGIIEALLGRLRAAEAKIAELESEART